MENAPILRAIQLRGKFLEYLLHGFQIGRAILVGSLDSFDEIREDVCNLLSCERKGVNLVPAHITKEKRGIARIESEPMAIAACT